MKPAVAFVGKKNSGKTTMLEKVIAELARRGRKVGVIKHDAHQFEIDHEGKDSYRLKHAGAKTVVITSADRFALVSELAEPVGLETIAARYFADCEIVLAEGWKREAKVKIEIFRKEVHDEPLCTGEEKGGLVALVTDDDVDLGVRKFGLDDAAGVADLIEEMFASDPEEYEARLIVDGKNIYIKGFVQEFVGNALEGMTKSLRGGADAKTIEIRLQLGRKRRKKD